MENVKADVAQIKFTLMQHLDRISQISMFKNCIKIFVPENNLGHEASHMWNMIKDYPNIRVYCHKEDEIGICKLKNTADDYQYTFHTKLDNNSIRFHRNLFTNNRKYSLESVKGIQREELERCRFSYDEPKNEHTKGRLTITGKLGNTEQDDLGIASQMCVYWPLQIFKNLSGIRKP